MSSERGRLSSNPRPKKVRGPGGRSGVLLGMLDELVVVRPGGSQRISDRKTSGLFVAWMPGTNNLALVRKVGKKPVNPRLISEKDKRVFKQFHHSPVRRVVMYDWPEKNGLRPIGRLRSLTYIVPKWVKSLEKWNHRWVHAFGDHGEEGHGLHTGTKRYSERLMPMLCKDVRGNLHIVRQPGNRYNVSEWIYW